MCSILGGNMKRISKNGKKYGIHYLKQLKNGDRVKMEKLIDARLKVQDEFISLFNRNISTARFQKKLLLEIRHSRFPIEHLKNRTRWI